MRFKDKVCLITGGGSGIGRATCRRLASEGGIVVVADRNAEHGQETARLIETAGAGRHSRASISGSRPRSRPPSMPRCGLTGASMSWSTTRG